MAEQRNWNLLGVILPPAEYRKPERYILKMCVLLCLYSYFCIMRAYYIAFLIMSINIDLQFKPVKDHIRTNTGKRNQAYKVVYKVLFLTPFCTVPEVYIHVVFTQHPYISS